MAKRKRRPPKQKQPDEGLLPPQPEENKEEVELAALENLRWCEAVGSMLPKVNGVPVVQCLTYELIQLVNRLSLQDTGLLPKDVQDG